MEDTPPSPGPRAEGPWPPTRGAVRAGRHEGICCFVRDGFGMDARRHGEKPNRSDGSAGTSQSSNIIPIIRLAVPSPGQRAAAPHSYHRRWVILYMLEWGANAYHGISFRAAPRTTPHCVESPAP